MYKSKWLAPKLVMAIALLGVVALPAQSASAATPAQTLDLNVLLIGAPVTSPVDASTGAWEAALTAEGVAYTEVDATGAYGSEDITLPALTSSATVGDFNAVVITDAPAGFAAGQLTTLDTYEADFGVRQIDGSAYPTAALGETDINTSVLDNTSGTLTDAGLEALPSLQGTIPFDVGTSGYPSTETSTSFVPWITNSTGVLAGVYNHPSTDAQSNVAELVLNFTYNASSLQWEIMAPSLINWVTQDTHLGIDRNYVEMDIDDTFTPDNAWSIAVHDNDYSDADSLRMSAADVITSAQWSQANDFRMDQLFNYGGSVEYQDCELDLPGDTCPNGVSSIPDPLLAEFQANDPTTGKPYADDFGWLSHTYDTPYLDVGCATQNYIEAELNENTSAAAAAPGATAGTGGLGLTESTNTALAYGYENPQVFVPGNHSGFADLAPGTPSTVDPPDLDSSTAGTGGNLAAGTYEYAVTDQFNGSDPTSTDQSQAYVTAPITVGASGTTALVWQAICHAANYIIYRAPVVSGVVGAWTQVGTYATPSSATLPDNSSGDPVSNTNVTNGGELELTFTDGSTTAAPAGQTYTDVAEPAGWTPPIVEDANELPWEQNPYFIPALEAVGITAVGADASKAYPTDPTDEFGIGATYTGTTYAPGVPFVDGTAEAVPRHPINVFYNASTDNQELDEYNTLYDADYPDSQCHDTSTTTCATTPFTFSQVVSSVVSGMFTNMLSNNPEPTYVHQTNIMGTVPYSTTCSTTGGMPPTNYTPSTTAADTTGEGLLYSVLDPLLCQYNEYFNANTPYEQLTFGAIGTTLAEQTAWATALAGGKVTASEQDGVITVTNASGATVGTPITAPTGTTIAGATFGQSYGGAQSSWVADTTSGVTLDAPTTLPTASLSTVATSSTDVFVVGRSPQNALWYQQSSGGGTSWSGWQGLPTTDAASKPSAVISGSNLYVFFRATDNELHYIVRTGTTWGAEQNLGGQISGNPSAAVDGNGRVIVAVLNATGSVYADSLPSGGSWTGWTSLSGTLNGDVTLATLGANVYLLGLNGMGTGWTLEWTAGTTNTWGSWTNLGGVFATGTTLAGVASGSVLHVQGVNPQGTPFETTGSGSSWSAWSSLNGVLAGTPSLAAPSAGLFMFGINENGQVWDQEDTTSWQGWNSLSGILEASPVAVAAGANAFVFGLDGDGSLWYREWNGTSFEAWTDLGGVLATT